MNRSLRSVVLVLTPLLLAAPARAVEKEAVQKAIERGVAQLRRHQQADGSWTFPYGTVAGPTSLAVLTMLECGVPANDPAVRKGVEYVRRDTLEVCHTYSVSLAILLFDRLGDPNDIPLIESLTVRLLKGQNAAGGWTYHGPENTGEEIERLRTLVGRRGGPAPPRPADAKPPKREPSKEIKEQLQTLVNNPVGAQVQPVDGFADDNSNTQFAVLALWAARKYGLPVDRALARVDARFRSSQNADGGWGYVYVPRGSLVRMGSTPAMTCAGLLGLGVAHAAAIESGQPKVDDLAKDPAIRAGFAALGTSIGHPAAKRADKNIPVLPSGGRFYYFLWSMERVAVAYGVDTILEKDWYTWGAEILLRNQQADGSWVGDHSQYAGADTCFALLFLRRANLARDLTGQLKDRFRDPGEAVLKGGGVGGAALAKLGLGSALEQTQQPSADGAGTGGRPRTGGTRPAGPAGEAAKLRSELIAAGADKQEQLLSKFKEGKGVAFTQELAAAIPRLTGAAKTKARDALAERLTGMTIDTLGEKLADEDLEIRRAAALASAMKESRPHIPKLIDLLEDPETPVVRAAHVALKHLTRQDFGPAADATRAERTQAVTAWKEWWKKQPK